MDILPQSDKIQILLHEYDGLRSEIVQRWAGTQQQISIAVLVLMGVITVLVSTKPEYPRILHVILGIAACIFIYAMALGYRDTCKAAERVREIEQDVNQRAGEELLQWESRWGGCVTGFWGFARPLNKPANNLHSN